MMSPNKQLKDGFKLSLPSNKLVTHWLLIANLDSPGEDFEDDAWDKKTYILLAITELAMKLYELLGTLPNVLRLPTNVHLRSSIMVPLPDRTMTPLVTRDSNTGQFFSEQFSQFRWGNNPISIAGLCATQLKPLLVELSDQHSRLQKYWVASPLSNYQGGILAVPMLTTLERRDREKQDCVAVISVYVQGRSVLNEDHLSALANFAEKITPIILRSTILPGSEDIKNRVIELLFRAPSQLFISYSHADSKFVDKLEAYLNKQGIRFWRDVHDATSGRLEKVVDRAMRLNPTVLLVLSEHSIKSDWVEHEVRTARELEREIGRDVLCPIALDASWKNSTWEKRIMEQVMKYNILDFSAWENDSKFENRFDKLIEGLDLFYK